MRNGVLAITRDGRLALINDEAYRVFGDQRRGRRISASRSPTVLKAHPEVVRVLTAAFELHHLPNRAEMRLKPQNQVIGYTLALVRDDRGEAIGAAMFFKDLTRVEQLEERERLRDRLAAVGEMAAVIAHEVKNPLAGIEVMAGLLRRKIPASPDAQALLDRHHQRSQDGQRHRAGSARLRPADPAAGRAHGIADAVQGGDQLADTKARRGAVNVDVRLAGGLPLIQGDQHQLMQLFTNLLINAYEAMGGTGRITITGETHAPRRRRRRARRRARRSDRRRPRDAAGGVRQGVRSVLHHQGAGLRARARHRPQDRRRARRPDRSADRARARARRFA